MVVRQGMTLVAFGRATGPPVALASTRALRSLIFDATPYDPWSFAGAIAVLCAVAFVACTASAVRASRVNPIAALRID